VQAVQNLRAALAVTPPAPAKIEGPVQKGDRVRLEGEVIDLFDDGHIAQIRVPTTGLRQVWVMDCTIVARPTPVAPPRTCKDCRWFQPTRATLFACRNGEVPGIRQVDAKSLACDGFELYPSEGAA
jgi:hypothetical protein